MKSLLMSMLIAATILPAKAQLFSRESLGGAMIGGIAGGIIGHNNGRRTAEGIGIGAGAGLLLGALTSQYRRDYYEGPYSSSYYAPSYYDAPAPRSRPNYAVTGAVLGGVAGGVIGHNNGRHTAEGIAIGAGTGLLLGGLAEYELRKRERLTPEVQRTYVVTQPATVLTTTPTVSRAGHPSEEVQVVQQATATASPSSMSGANALFGR